MPRLPGVTVSHVRGFGRRVPADPDGEAFDAVDMAKLEVIRQRIDREFQSRGPATDTPLPR